jgi:hypothetical protein
MNKLHFEYLSDTGEQPIKSYLWDLYFADKITEEAYDTVSDELINAGVNDIYTPEYVEWLENKIKELRNE